MPQIARSRTTPLEADGIGFRPLIEHPDSVCRNMVTIDGLVMSVSIVRGSYRKSLARDEMEARMTWK